MKGARPAELDLIRWQPGVVEGRFVEEIGNAVGISAPNQCRNRIDDQSEVILGSIDFVKGLPPKLANARDQLTIKRLVMAVLGFLYAFEHSISPA
jgi:hypothetical protein